MSEPKPKSPDIARFGAALPRGAEELRADEFSATYRVEGRLDDLCDFYQAIYGATKGVVMERVEEAKPKLFAVATGPKCREADFSLLLVRPTEARDKPLEHEITVLARGDDDIGGYPDLSPWMDPNR
jgi:hypothetical protein